MKARSVTASGFFCVVPSITPGQSEAQAAFVIRKQQIPRDLSNIARMAGTARNVGYMLVYQRVASHDDSPGDIHSKHRAGGVALGCHTEFSRYGQAAS